MAENPAENMPADIPAEQGPLQKTVFPDDAYEPDPPDHDVPNSRAEHEDGS